MKKSWLRRHWKKIAAPLVGLTVGLPAGYYFVWGSAVDDMGDAIDDNNKIIADTINGNYASEDNVNMPALLEECNESHIESHYVNIPGFRKAVDDAYTVSFGVVKYEEGNTPDSAMLDEYLKLSLDEKEDAVDYFALKTYRCSGEAVPSRQADLFMYLFMDDYNKEAGNDIKITD